MRGAFGDRGHSLIEFSVLSGLVLGSFGLLLFPWMAGAAPWGFAAPVLFIGGYVYLDHRRQAALARGGAAESIERVYDLSVLALALSAAAMGAAAFVIAWNAIPATPSDPHIWSPPADAVDADLAPASR